MDTSEIMLKKNDCQTYINGFRAKHGIEGTDENIIAAIHLMNTHGVDINAALDQSSRSGNDHGIDAWFFDDESQELFIYQSKLSESRSAALRGYNDLGAAQAWLEQVIVEGIVENIPSDNHCLFNLYTLLSQIRELPIKICFVLISLFDKMEVEDSTEYQAFEDLLIKSPLNEYVRRTLKGKLMFRGEQYNLEYSIPARAKVYPISRIPNARVDLRHNAHLDVAYVSLYSLVELYRQRGNVLFDKNVRLSLMGTKEARERLVHPMEETLGLITNGKLSPSIFPFYHIGVTISATFAGDEDTNLLNLEAPSIINGCQTISIANEFLKKLEKKKDEPAIDYFKQIKVVAKVVVGTSNEELKEITNSNNRQNPIENWQLFSNEPIHIEIEAALKDIGVFYERQRGKFDSIMKSADNARYYNNTNATYIKVVDLAQTIALSKKMLQWAAKPSEIFLNKENHDKIFDRTIPKYPRDIMLTSNLFKAMKRGLNKYLVMPTHGTNPYAPIIFKKPIVRTHVYYLVLLYYYQNRNKGYIRSEFSKKLNKIASTTLVDDMQTFYQKIVTKVRNWYIEESKKLEVEVSKKRMDAYFADLAIELGIDSSRGCVPFSSRGIDWSE